jgi:hypothetical protein
MKTILQLEELAMFLFSIFLFSQLHFAWWWFVVLVLLSDISMLGYLTGNKTGAFLYNIVHHKGVALVLSVWGCYSHNAALQLVGIILFGHSSMDRMMGYGLKYETGFTNTHLGMIGKKQ